MIPSETGTASHDKGYLLLMPKHHDNVSKFISALPPITKGILLPDNHYYDKDNGAFLVTDRLSWGWWQEFCVDKEGNKFDGASIWTEFSIT